MLTAATRHALRQPELTAMEMSGADLDRLAGRALGTFRFLLTPDISPHCAEWFEGPLSVKPFINPERVWGAVVSNPRVGAIATVVDRLLMHEWLSIPGRNASTPA